jgi:hypothetical protein
MLARDLEKREFSCPVVRVTIMWQQSLSPVDYNYWTIEWPVAQRQAFDEVLDFHLLAECAIRHCNTATAEKSRGLSHAECLVKRESHLQRWRCLGHMASTHVLLLSYSTNNKKERQCHGPERPE